MRTDRLDRAERGRKRLRRTICDALYSACRTGCRGPVTLANTLALALLTLTLQLLLPKLSQLLPLEVTAGMTTIIIVIIIVCVTIIASTARHAPPDLDAFNVLNITHFSTEIVDAFNLLSKQMLQRCERPCKLLKCALRHE